MSHLQTISATLGEQRHIKGMPSENLTWWVIMRVIQTTFRHSHVMRPPPERYTAHVVHAEDTRVFTRIAVQLRRYGELPLQLLRTPYAARIFENRCGTSAVGEVFIAFVER